jgi:hypothetical protein
MIELYHHGSSVCAAKVRFALGEKGLAWQGHYIDILKGALSGGKIVPKSLLREGTRLCRVTRGILHDPRIPENRKKSSTRGS